MRMAESSFIPSTQVVPLTDSNRCIRATELRQVLRISCSKGRCPITFLLLDI